MIRRAELADALLLAELHIASWQEAYRDDFPHQFLAGLDVEQRRRFFASTISRGGLVLVSDSDAEPTGFCFAGDSDRRGWAEIYAIYVHPDHWRRGHGRALIEAAEEELEALGHRQALLWVLASNQRARSFYQRQGWSLAKPVRIEEIGGVQVTEVCYQKRLGDDPPLDRGRRERSP